MSTRAGRVWLTGAGPGDPDLLTVAARRLIDTAGAVVHDRLVGDAIIASIPRGTLRFHVGKTGYGHATGQDEIVELLVRLARRGLDVVRLKGGDPFVFGRGGEEALALLAAGIDVGVVPGVTAGVAGPAAAGIPVTYRGIARSVAFVTGHAADSGPGPNWAEVAAADTIVVFMAGRTAPVVASALRAAGRSGETPAAVITDATLPGQTVETLDLAVLAARDEHAPDGRAPDGAATLLVIGDVVRFAHALGPLWATVRP